ncbi:adenylate/guanylate cyclase domain-containing protein [Nonomuraea sp. NPDC005650]|uniref:adenylate/guanylate cyclase domain-containing protein n=1 Tax=Nonomuraea sp. NPDC005650 TaxID=3157045 RepID=UPI0033AC3B4D
MTTIAGTAGGARCRRCQEVSPSTARFCMRCGARVTVAEPAPAELRLVTVVFCDIVKSTELANRLGAEVWTDVLDAYFGQVGAALEARGGRLEKFIGDAVVAVFGADGGREDDATRAVAAARDALRRLARYARSLRRRGVELSARFGVASGRVVAADRDASFAVGSVMNRAARLQQAASSGEIVVDLKTWLLVRGTVPCHPLTPLSVKGFAEPLRAWRVDTSPRRPPDVAPRLVNQTALVRELTRQVTTAIAEPGVSTLRLEGDMGVGKTRILRELTRRLGDDVQTIFLTCGPGARRDQLWLLYQLERALGGALSVRGSAVPRTAAELVWLLTRRLRALAAHRPMLVIVDDAAPARAGLERLARACASAQESIVFLLGAREAGLTGGDRLVVRPLSDEHARDLLDEITRSAPLRGGAARADEIVRRATGNPLFVEQLALLAATGLDELIPPSAEAALGSRLDRLSREARQVLGCAGAWGEDVELPDFVATCDLDDPAFDGAMAELAEAGLLDGAMAEPAGAGPLDGAPVGATLPARVAYTRLRLADRAAVHTRIAELLQARASRRPEAMEAAAAHAERAHRAWLELDPGSRSERAAAVLAASCLCTAARVAVAQSRIPPALRLAEEAGALAGEDRALRAEIAVVQTYAMAAAGRPTEALARIREVRRAVPATVNLPAAAHLHANEIAINLGTGVWDTALLAEAHRLAELSGERGALARLLLVEALRDARAGDYAAAEARLRTARLTATDLPLCFGASEIYGNLALCLVYGDAPPAVALSECLELREEVAGRPALHAAVSCPAAFLLAMTGDEVEAERVISAAESAFADMGHAIGLAGLYEFRSMIAELLGDPAAGAAWAGRAAARYAEIGLPAAAYRCRLRAGLLDGHGPADGEEPDEHASWDLAVLARLAAALGHGERGRAGRALSCLDAALRRIDDVSGKGAITISIRSCRRVAAKLGGAAMTHVQAFMKRREID